MTSRVILLAQTIVNWSAFRHTPYSPHPFLDGADTVLSADELAEFSARSVHGTWSLDSTSNRDYLRALLNLGETEHMEHSSATFWINGVSVGLARAFSAFPGLRVTEKSFTYADPQEIRCVVPAAFQHDEELCTDLTEYFDKAMGLYEDSTRALTRRGFTRSHCEQAARAYLPDCAETTLVVTGSMLTFRYALDEWLLPSADAEARTVALAILGRLRDIAPNSFQDFEIGPRWLPEADDAKSELGVLSVARLSPATSRAV